MNAHFLLLLLSIVALPTLAAGQISYLDVKDGIVVFATDEGKTSAAPGCTAAATADKWALSLENDNGRAIYSLLMTAMATKMAVGVETAADCADSAGFERPSRVWFEVAATSAPEPEPTSTVETITTFKTVAYGMKTNTSCSVLANIKSSNGVYYMYTQSHTNGNTSCRCQEDSRLVTVASTDYQYASHYQCVIEVKTPVIP